MPTLHESALSEELRELQAWYLNELRPKIVRAAGSGDVGLAAAAAGDHRLRELLRLPVPEDERAA